MSIVPAFDVTVRNYSAVPAGQRCGYDTGDGIAWTSAMWADNPGAVHIAQAVVLASDETTYPDILDVERGAATFADCAPWVIAMRAAYTTNKRPGQRQPAIYCSASNVTNVVNALIAGGVTSDVGLWVANWSLSEAAAIADVMAAAGPFPIIGIQFSDTGGGGSYDLDVFSVQWLSKQSGVAGNTVAEGSSGPAVKALQTALNAAISARLALDSLFGPATLAAVKSLQAVKKLVVDGIAGPATWKVLESVQPGPQLPAPAPTDLNQSVRSTAASVVFSWDAVPDVPAATGYLFQLEWWKPGFGWVLTINKPVEELTYTCALSPQSKYRWRVAADTASRIWPGWQSFETA